MKTKCYKCGHKNERDVYSCEQCGEIFRESEEKYKIFLKNKEKQEEEYRSKEPIEPSYKRAKRICRIPFVIGLLYAGKSIPQITGNEKMFILIILRGLIITLILLGLKKLVIKYAKRKNQSEFFVNAIMAGLLILLFFVIPYFISLFM